MTDWTLAACLQHDGSLWMQTSNPRDITADNRRAIAICAECPIREACLADTLAYEAGLAVAGRWHIAGAATPAERAAMDPAAGTAAYHTRRSA